MLNGSLVLKPIRKYYKVINKNKLIKNNRDSTYQELLTNKPQTKNIMSL